MPKKRLLLVRHGKTEWNGLSRFQGKSDVPLNDEGKCQAELLAARLEGVAGLRVHRPDAGMFALVDVRATGLSGTAFAESLLETEHVAVMPGESFGLALAGWLRLALSQPDAVTAEAATRIARHAAHLLEQAA